ncbi:MAG: tRNA pseudouridine(38-40) synthase TruA [Deltaproteobacteria bacterium]|nr:MAG: tRNA pseudouridine(38-40) synthase TruA [Deltaproteobacteria bacterium]
MRSIKLVIEYEGTNYHGWQTQRNASTIQEVLGDKLRIITDEVVKTTAASRTDAGVHARGQTVNFKTNSGIEPEALQRGLNSLLPPDIVVRSVSEVEEDFNSRRDAKSKVYQYIILNRKIPSTLYRRFSWFIPEQLDVRAMKKAAALLKGEHDFSSFRASDCDSSTPWRRVKRISVRKEKDFIKINIEANAFLRYMVRSIVGSLVEVGRGKITVNEFGQILEARDRTRAGPTAPAQGLFLVEVKY